MPADEVSFQRERICCAAFGGSRFRSKVARVFSKNSRDSRNRRATRLERRDSHSCSASSSR